jgi:hypothetical protein
LPPLFATSVDKIAAGTIETDGRFATGVNNISVTGGKIFVDTCGKFATSVVDTSCAP